MFSLTIGRKRFPSIPKLRELTPEEIEQDAKGTAEWQRREEERKAATAAMIRTAHLVTLTGACLQAIAHTGQWSLASHEDAVDDAKYLLELIEKPEPERDETRSEDTEP